jgi:RNA polymerase sigma factor (sigma-70 family)
MPRMRTQDFERLYEQYAQPLYGFLTYRTGDPVLAEDLVADTFERVLTARRPFDPRRAGEKTWLYAIALNRLRDVARRSAAERRAIAGAPTDIAAGNGDNGFETVDTRQVVVAALAVLSDDEREVVALRYGADLSLAEIAKLVDVPRSTVEGRLYKGLKRLRAELGEHDPAPISRRAALG